MLNIARLQPKRAELTRPCTAHNMDKSRAVIKAIKAHKVARLILPKEVEDEEAARLLSVLNTNSHELGEWGGSGFFPLACLCEHSCQVSPGPASSTPICCANVRSDSRVPALCAICRRLPLTLNWHLIVCVCVCVCPQPNCAFNTSETDLWVTVVRPVKKVHARAHTCSSSHCKIHARAHACLFLSLNRVFITPQGPFKP